MIDPSITTTVRGIWAIKWSFVFFAITAAFQLWVAFVVIRRKPTARFTYALGRVEDPAGLLIEPTGHAH